MIQALRSNKRFLTFFSVKGVGEFIILVVPFIVARVLSEEAFAQFSLAQIVATVVVALFINSAQSGIVVEAAKREDRIRTVFTAQLVLVGTILLSGAVLTLLLQGPIASFVTIPESSVWFVFLLFVGISLKNALTNTFLSLNKRVQSAVFALGVGLLQLAVIAVILWTGEPRAEDIMIAYAAGSVGATLVSIFFLPWKRLFPLEYDGEVMRSILKWAVWQSAGFVAVYVVNWVDQIAIKYAVDTVSVATYNVAYQLFKATTGAALLLNMYFLPVIARSKTNTAYINRYVRKILPAIAIGGVVVSVVAFFVVPSAFTLFFGPDKYGDAGGVFQALSGAIAAFVLMAGFLPLFNAFERYRFVQLANVAIVVVNVLLDIVLVQRFGLFGPAWATVAAYLAGASLYLWYYRYRLRPSLNG